MNRGALEDLGAAILDTLRERGPLTGSELVDLHPDVPALRLWQASHTNSRIRRTNSARFYLRYDVTREDQIRLSPSILRSFLTYTLLHAKKQEAEATEKASLLANRFRTISRRKTRLAQQAVLSLDADLREELSQGACAFVSGDLSYLLGHDVERPHRELDLRVRGSDIDIVFVHQPQIDASIIARCEEQLLATKYRFLKDPGLREELDFVFKPVGRMIDQLGYGDIHQKIASKVLYESVFLFGNLTLYDSLLRNLDVFGTRERIERDFTSALLGRKETLRRLLEDDLSDPETDPLVASLFFFSQERVEMS